MSTALRCHSMSTPYQDYETITRQIVETVAERSNRETTELPPLYHSVDADALATLLSSDGDPPDSSVEITFEYAGCVIRLTAEKTEVVRDIRVGQG